MKLYSEHFDPTLIMTNTTYTVEKALQRIEEFAAMLSSIVMMAAHNDEALSTNAYYGMYEACDDIETLARSVFDTLQKSKSALSLELVELEGQEEQAREEDEGEKEDKDEEENHEAGVDEELAEAVSALAEARRKLQRRMRNKKPQ